MSDWAPHATVATVIEDDGRYLLVEERDKFSGELVFNQPAGHLEPNESLVEAAVRETLEETGWCIELSGVLGIALYTAPGNQVTYLRTTFVGKPICRAEGAKLDPDIHAIHWLDYEEILSNSDRMRSPLVIASIERYRRDTIYPVDFIFY